MKIRTFGLFILLSFFPLAFGACSSGGDEGGDVGKPEQFTRRYNSGQSFYSQKLGQVINYAVLLPQKYLTESDTDFGVVYLLHGWGGDDNSWGPSGLNIQTIVDAAEQKSTVRPLIYVMPQGFNTYFCNRYDGEYNYMDMLTDELIPLIDKRFRTTAKASERAVSGFSMGGFGALSLVSQHPELFKTAIGLSPSINSDGQYTTLSQDGWDLQWGSIFGGSGKTGQGRITAYYKSQCPLHFFADESSSGFQDINYYIDCGDDEERLYVGNGELHTLMRQKGITHQYRVRNGAHTEAYWRESMVEALAFIEYSFKGETYPLETVRSFDDDLHSTSRSVSVGNSEVELWLPSDYDPASTYKVLYYSKGTGRADVTTRQVAVALDSLMQIKKLVIVGFDIQKIKQNGTSFAELCNAVESAVHTESAADYRLALVYGSDADYLYGSASGDNPEISYFFAEDAAIEAIASKHSSKLYYLDITDDGSENASMYNLFTALREQNANVQYRVRNGKDTSASAMTGINSMNYFISEPLTKK